MLRYLDDVDAGFLQYITKEVGIGTPVFADDASTRQFLKEAKAWHAGKGSEFLYSYIGALTKTLINIWEPSRLILRTDYPPTVVDGVVNKPSLDTSKLNRIRDGIFWSFYTYVLEVNGAQNLKHWSDITNLVELIHPAGTKYFVDLFYQWDVVPTVPSPLPLNLEERESFIVQGACLIDNQLTSDGPCLIDGHTALYWYVEVFQESSFPYTFGGRYLAGDTLLNDYVVGTSPLMTWRVNIADPGEPSGYRTGVGPESDAIVLNHLAVVASASTYTYLAIRDMPYSGIQVMHYKTSIDDWAINGLQFMHYQQLMQIIRYQDFEDQSNPGVFYEVEFGAEILVNSGPVSGISGWELNDGWVLIVDNGAVNITQSPVSGSTTVPGYMRLQVVNSILVYDPTG